MILRRVKTVVGAVVETVVLGRSSCDTEMVDCDTKTVETDTGAVEAVILGRSGL